MEKTDEFIYLCVYLILSTLLLSYIGVGELWSPDVPLTPQTYSVSNFSEISNISSFNIDITKGNWNITNGKLIAIEDNSELFIVNNEIVFYPSIEYNVSGITSNFKIYLYNYETPLKNTVTQTYLLFDYTNNSIIIIKEEWYNYAHYIEFLQKWYYNIDYLKTNTFSFTKDNYYIKVELSDYIFEESSCIINLKIDNSYIIQNYKLIPYQVSKKNTGIFTKNKGLYLTYFSFMEQYEEEEFLALFDYMKIFFKILIFPSPLTDQNIPIWVDILFIKIQLMRVMMLAILIIRGI